jgi:DNA-binding response OmpR family regulator
MRNIWLYVILFTHMTEHTPHKLLVVEDSEPLRKVLAEKLRDEKFLVLEASGGEEGMRIATDQKPDLIITDVVMFPVDGLEMASRIRASGAWGKEVHIIALTNQNSAEEEGRLTNLNLTAYLVKAETGLDDVVTRIKAVLKKKK